MECIPREDLQVNALPKNKIICSHTTVNKARDSRRPLEPFLHTPMTPPAIDMSSTPPATEDNKPRNSAFRIGLGDLTVNNLGQLKRLNSVLFPITYDKKFYDEMLEVGEFAKISTCLKLADHETDAKQKESESESTSVSTLTASCPSIVL